MRHHIRPPSLLLRRGAAMITALVLALGVGLTGPAAPAHAAAGDTATIVSQTNAARAAKGLPALKRNAAMDTVAQAWAVKMAADGYQHNPDYSSQIPAGWSMAAENIAWNYSSATVVRAWLNSPGHYANIMTAHTDIGVGYYVARNGEIFSVQNFARYPALTGDAPTVSGVPRAGQVLTAAPGTWSPAPVALSYQWLRAGVAISGANARTYVVRNADAARTLTVSVTGKKTGYSSVTKTSTPTSAVTGTITNAPVPTVGGVVRVGQTVGAAAGTWAPAPITLIYQWKKAGTVMAGETGRTYVIRPDDVDAVLSVSVTGSRASYAAVTKQSAATIRVAGVAYPSCTALRAAYPSGVARAGLSGETLAQAGSPRVSNALYALNTARDVDSDGIACEP
ncbi:CAP domain-containing protein [Cryobacterium sp. SO2]|uniref:CAP domain-containing protein n=1 Tax=Cryobacterium sp. SO2 TaxID=1897060 RepID=UPI00223E1807|nr:CAP domain-containing protein [Cryobacterium sp. SO2]WEO76782.1 CAP domain-containing protein [Cryobacterium sp. SO2]